MKIKIIILALLSITSFCYGSVKNPQITPNLGIVSIPAGAFGCQAFTYKPGTYLDSKGNEVKESDAKNTDWSVIPDYIKGLFGFNPQGNTCTVNSDGTKVTHSSRDTGKVSCKSITVRIRAL